MSAVPNWLLLGGVALVLVAAQLIIVARHPEPGDDEPDVEHKPRYAGLMRPAVIVLLGLLAFVLCLPIAGLPAALRPAWVVWAAAGLVLAWVDARTTWLPIRATRFTAICLAAALATGVIVDPRWWPSAVLRTMIGAGVAWALFWVLWRLSNSLGFGDVRLAGLMGGLTAMGSAQWWFLGIFGGSLAAACWGLGTVLWRRHHPSPLGRAFPYGPGLWLGPWLAWVWLAAGGVVPMTPD